MHPNSLSDIRPIKENPCVAAAEIYHLSGLLNQFLAYILPHIRETGHNAADRECSLAIAKARKAVIAATLHPCLDSDLVKIYRDAIKAIKSDVLPFVRMPNDPRRAHLIDHLVLRIHDTKTSETTPRKTIPEITPGLSNAGENQIEQIGTFYRLFDLISQLLDHILPHVYCADSHRATQKTEDAVRDIQHLIVSAAHQETLTEQIDSLHEAVKKIKAKILPFVRMPNDPAQYHRINQIVMSLHDA